MSLNSNSSETTFASKSTQNIKVFKGCTIQKTFPVQPITNPNSGNLGGRVPIAFLA